MNVDPSAAPTRPVSLAGGVGPTGLVGRRAKLWQNPHYGYPDGFPSEAVVLDYRDGLVHVCNEAGKDFWMPVLLLGCIELVDEPGDGPVPGVEFKNPEACPAMTSERKAAIQAVIRSIEPGPIR